MTRSVALEYTPTRRVISTSMQISSRVSLRAASSTDSPRSRKPPGKVHSPWPGSKPRRRRMISPLAVRGIAAATGLGLKKRTNPQASHLSDRGGSFAGVAPQRGQCWVSSRAGLRLATRADATRMGRSTPACAVTCPVSRTPARTPARSPVLPGGCLLEKSSKEVAMTSPDAVRTPAKPGPADVEPAHAENLHRALTGLVTVVPVLALGVAAWQSWNGTLRPRDLAILAVL